MGGVFAAIKRFVDSVFRPPIAFLDMAIERLSNINMVTAQGINFGKYISFFRDMPYSWQLVVSSLLLTTTLLGALILVKVMLRLYFTVKGGVKWW